MGYSLLCDPRAIIGHRFRESTADYSAPHEHCLFNELRMARKNLGDKSWRDWVKLHQKRTDPQVWAAAWELFEQDRRSVELERDFLHANRVRDEYQYARRFGLAWPSSSPRSRAIAAPSPRVASPHALPGAELGDLEAARIKRTAGEWGGPTKRPLRKPRPTKKPPLLPTKRPLPKPTKKPPLLPTKRPLPRPSKKSPLLPTKLPPKKATTKRPPKRPT
jgi:hypothetical protein